MRRCASSQNRAKTGKRAKRVQTCARLLEVSFASVVLRLRLHLARPLRRALLLLCACVRRALGGRAAAGEPAFCPNSLQNNDVRQQRACGPS